MYCTKCGQQTDPKNKEKYCTKCGNLLNENGNRSGGKNKILLIVVSLFILLVIVVIIAMSHSNIFIKHPVEVEINHESVKATTDAEPSSRTTPQTNGTEGVVKLYDAYIKSSSNINKYDWMHTELADIDGDNLQELIVAEGNNIDINMICGDEKYEELGNNPYRKNGTLKVFRIVDNKVVLSISDPIIDVEYMETSSIFDNVIYAGENYVFDKKIYIIDKNDKKHLCFFAKYASAHAVYETTRTYSINGNKLSVVDNYEFYYEDEGGEVVVNQYSLNKVPIRESQYNDDLNNMKPVEGEFIVIEHAEPTMDGTAYSFTGLNCKNIF